MRPSFSLLIVFLATLIAFDVLQAADQTQSATPSPATNSTSVTKDTSNVVLGRELILVTKQIENITRLQQELLSLRAEIVGPVNSTSQSLNAIDRKVQQIKQSVATRHDSTVKELRTRLQELKEELSTMHPASEPTSPKPSPPAEPAKNSATLHRRKQSTSTLVSFEIDSILIAQTSRVDVSAKMLTKLGQIKHAVQGAKNEQQRDEISLQNAQSQITNLADTRHGRLSRQRSFESRLDSLERLLLLRASSDAASLQPEDYDTYLDAHSVPYRAALRQFASPFGVVEGDSEFGVRSPQSGSLSPFDGVPDIKLIPQHIQGLTLDLDDIESRVRKTESSIEQAEDEIKSIRDDDQTVTDNTKSLDAKAGQLLAQVGEQFREVRARKAQFENALGDRDAGLNQYQINYLLVYAVYGMIISIIVLFVLLRWYPANLTDLIVEQRVIVEVLSMGFLLVTVIILGSAKLIQGEGLAGLLGTIAGYIFAKKTADMLSSARASAGAGTIERQMAQAHLEVKSLGAQVEAKRSALGETPSEKQKLDLAKTEEQLKDAQVRLDALSNSLTAVTKAKLAGMPTVEPVLETNE